MLTFELIHPIKHISDNFSLYVSGHLWENTDLLEIYFSLAFFLIFDWLSICKIEADWLDY